MNDPTDDEHDTPLGSAVASHWSGGPSQPLNPDDRAVFDDLLPWLDMLRAAAIDSERDRDLLPAAYDADLPADDPVALLLGLVADPERAVDGRRLASARKHAGVNVAELGERLRMRGWQVTTKQVLGWELGDTSSLVPALALAVADELDVPVDRLLRTDRAVRPDADVLSDARIAAFLDDWAAQEQFPRDELAERVVAALAAAGRRNATQGAPEAVLAVLKVLRAVPNFLRRP